MSFHGKTNRAQTRSSFWPDVGMTLSFLLANALLRAEAWLPFVPSLQSRLGVSARKYNPSPIFFRGKGMRSYLENFVESLFPWSKPGGGKTSLGVCTVCTWCDGRGYLKKNANVWRACPKCYGGHFWIPPSPHEEEFAESGLSQNKENGRLTS